MAQTLRLLSRRDVSDSAYVLRLERGDFSFAPGQYLTLGEAGGAETREYSIYSGVQDPYLEVLIKEVAGGSVSRRLRRLAPGSELRCDGPFGFFTLGNGLADRLADEHADRPLLWVATGTGIAPFHSFVTSYGDLDYLLLHGVRAPSECYEREAYPAERYLACVSEPNAAMPGPAEHRSFAGRVTAYLRHHAVAAGTRCFLCGNSAMIFEVFDLLKRQGVPSADIAAEVYF